MKMKIVRLLTCGIMLTASLTLQAQSGTATKLKSTIAPLRLDIGSSKTTNLVFPYAIISVDRGSKDVLVQKAKGVENILQVKAGSDTLKETNLTVITADGALYSFVLQYAFQPTVLNVNLGLSGTATPAGILETGSDNEARMQTTAEQIATKQPLLKLQAKNADISVRLMGIYIQDSNLYFNLSVKNNSNIRYDIEQLRFFIRDQKHSNRTASQELEQSPLHVHGNIASIGTRCEGPLVFVLPKFTIPDRKVLLMQLMERNGGRHVQMKIRNKTLTSAREIR